MIYTQSFQKQVTCTASYYGAVSFDCAVSGYTLLGVIGFNASQYQNNIGISGVAIGANSTVSTIWRNHSTSQLTDDVTIKCLYVKS